jgi:hypothetical protein
MMVSVSLGIGGILARSSPRLIVVNYITCVHFVAFAVTNRGFLRKPLGAVTLSHTTP